MEEVCWRYEAALEHCKARMVESADTADLKSADPNRSWGFKSPSGYQFYVEIA